MQNKLVKFAIFGPVLAAIFIDQGEICHVIVHHGLLSYAIFSSEFRFGTRVCTGAPKLKIGKYRGFLMVFLRLLSRVGYSVQ